jgi:excisionase family DNA binding protein
MRAIVAVVSVTAMNDYITPLLSTRKLSQIFDVTPATIRRWRAAGKLRAVRVGRRWRFRRIDVERLLNDPKTP